MARTRERAFYLFVAPWLLLVVLFQVGPMLFSFLLTFTEWRAIGWPQWVGATNYTSVAQDPLFAKTMSNTLLYALGNVPLTLILGLGLALALNKRGAGMGLFRTIFFLPVVVSGVAVTLVWGWLFNSQYGLVNQALRLVGIAGPAWLQEAEWAMPALIIMSLWSVGGTMLIYLAALQRLPRDLYEAAALDGAGAGQRFWHLTLPLLSPATLFLTVVGVLNAFQVFTPAYVLTKGGPDNATLTTALYIYLNFFRWGERGNALVMAWLLCLLLILLSFVQLRGARRWVFYEGG